MESQGVANYLKALPLLLNDAISKLKTISEASGMDILDSVISLEEAYDSKKVEK
jgi:hypothetical protein